MTEPHSDNLGSFPSRAAPSYGQGSSANLADILERVLDKGIVIAGDIQINLLDIELLTIKLRLLVASVDKAKEMGIDWWEHDPSLSSRADSRPSLSEENRRLREEIAALRGTRSLDRAEPVDEVPRGAARGEVAREDVVAGEVTEGRRRRAPTRSGTPRRRTVEDGTARRRPPEDDR
ncbi:gas vesicle protein [Streptomyces lavendulocolor]|uniref:gas vesicle protein n=1 Tax=Streptomyces lavendulocolor TaxID=67316 RepID=UPI003C305E3D